jgi:histidinol dehydrogenase
MSDRDHQGGFFQGLILGALIGVGAFYFLTQTKEGKRIGQQLRKKGEEALDDLGEMVEDLETKSEEFRIKAKEIQSQLEEKTQGVSKEIAEEAQEKLGHIEQLRERGRTASKKFFIRNGKPLTS